MVGKVMNEKELIEFRALLQGHLIRMYNHSLNIHKEESRIEDLIRILDSYLIKELPQCQ